MTFPSEFIGVYLGDRQDLLARIAGKDCHLPIRFYKSGGRGPVENITRITAVLLE